MVSFFVLLVIHPIYQAIEFIYRVFLELCKNPGIAVIGVSAGVTFFCLPLYAVAEKWQQIERDTQKRLKPGIERIKSTFKGDEQYMILSTFYRENHYHPMMALRSSISLLIQIPFFIAAYGFLTHCPDLEKTSFLFIKDLGVQDAIFHVGNFPINILPIAMTLINIIAGAIYTKGFPLREKLQIYIMAVIFLFVLYNSPSGLVVYWTMNNIFSLVKNILYKIKNPLKIFWLFLTAFFFLLAIYVFVTMKPTQGLMIFGFALLVLFSPKIIKLNEWLIDNVLNEFLDNKSVRNSAFIFSAISIALLTGFVIPSFLITSSTASDFAYIDSYTNPLYFIYNSSVQCFGLFFLWPAVIYSLFNKRIQTEISFLFVLGLFWALLNAFCFPGDYGNISADLIFTEHKTIHPDPGLFISSITALIFTTAVIIFLLKKKLKIIKGLMIIVLFALTGLSLVNGISIQKAFEKTPKPDVQHEKIQKAMKFSKNGKNVLVFMLDKAPGYLVDFAFSECPELNDQLSGFTFYPNTVSFGSWTVQGAPGLYGGYEYTPWSMNHKRSLSMQEKHNQALSVLPFMFEKNGFNSYLIDPPYPNYDELPVFSFVEGHDKVYASKLLGKYSDLWYKQTGFPKVPLKSMRIKRNFLWFSIFKCVTPAARSIVHYKDWWSSPDYGENLTDFIERYSILDFLPELTETDSSENCFIFIDNEATHDPGLVQPPDFKPVAGEPDYNLFKNNFLAFDPTYHALLASLKRIGEWLDYLKANGVYDNTRIIIASDHGAYHRFPTIPDEGDLPRNIEWFNPMLMVKDFNSKGALKQDNTFMTQADVPAIAADKVIENPVNPFTGNKIVPLASEEKKEKSIISFSKANRVLATENNGFIISDDDWYSVKDNIFDISNWKKLNIKNGDFSNDD